MRTPRGDIARGLSGGNSAVGAFERGARHRELQRGPDWWPASGGAAEVLPGGLRSLDMSKEEAAKWRALLNRPMSATAAAVSGAVIGPTPGIVARRGAVRSGISTATGGDIRPTAKAGSDSANASMCCAAATAAVRIRCKWFGYMVATVPGARSGEKLASRSYPVEIYAAVISRVALAGSLSTLQGANRFASPQTCGNRRSTPRPHKFS
jgi:hypothetical protein